MNIEGTNDLLVHIQIVDNRQVGDATVLEWHELVGDLDYDEALEAVRLHFRDSTEYLKPAHVRAGVERIRLAGFGPQRDEFENDLPLDLPAVAAFERLHPETKAITS
jgi:hypothetical protein